MSFAKNKPIIFSIVSFFTALIASIGLAFLSKALFGVYSDKQFMFLKVSTICLPILYLIVLILNWRVLNLLGRISSIVFFLFFALISFGMFVQVDSTKLIPIPMDGTIVPNKSYSKPQDSTINDTGVSNKVTVE